MKPFIVTLTGPSCAGKSTLEDKLIAKGFAPIVSVATRAPRPGEVDGVDYTFISQARMIALREGNQLVESIDFGGYSYAVTREEIESKAATGQPIVVVVEPVGRNQIAEYCESNGWTHHAVYVGNPERVIADRFLKRVQAELSESKTNAGDEAVLKRSSERLATMMTTERAWEVEAFFQLDHTGRRPYNRILAYFNEENGDSATFSILNSFYEYLRDEPRKILAA